MIEKSRNYTLLTGATGLVGGHLLVELLRSQLAVAVLVRSARRQSALERVEAILAGYEGRLGRRLPRPVVISADLVKPLLGIRSSDREWLAARCCRSVHCAAHLSFSPAASHPQNEPFRTNIDGTRNLTDLCRSVGIAEFHHVSTAYICGRQAGARLEHPASVDVEFCNDYEFSKAMSEQMLQAVGFDSLTIYRPSIVADVSGPGATDQPIQHAYSAYSLLRKAGGDIGDAELHGSLGLTGRECKNIVRADWLARVLSHIIRRPSLHGCIYHLTTKQPTSLSELTTAFRQVFEETRVPERIGNRDQLPNTTANALTQQFVQAFKPYFRDDPEFDRRNLRRALQICGIPDCPPITVADLKTVSAQALKSRTSPGAAMIVGSQAGVSLRQLESKGPIPEDDDHSFALDLHGEQGGAWTISMVEKSGLVVYSGRGGCTRRVMASTSTFNILIRGDLRVIDAEEKGLILLEYEDELNGSKRLRSQFQRLVEAIRLMHTKHDSGINSELSHVE